MIAYTVSKMKEILIRAANKTFVDKNIPNTAVNPTAVNPTAVNPVIPFMNAFK